MEMDFNFNILYHDGGRVRGGSGGAVGGSTFIEGGRIRRRKGRRKRRKEKGRKGERKEGRE